VDPAGGVLDDREAGQPGEQHGVAVEQVASENFVRWAAQELSPGRIRAPRGRIGFLVRWRIAQTVEAPT
jgi:hypothetical protein